MTTPTEAGEIRERISNLIDEGLKNPSRTDAHWRSGLNPELAELLGIPVTRIATKTLNKPGSVSSRFQGAAFDPIRSSNEPVELGVFIYHASDPKDFNLDAAVRYGNQRLKPAGVRALAYFVPEDDAGWTLGALVVLQEAVAPRGLLDLYPDAVLSEAAGAPLESESRYFVLFQRSDPEYKDVLGTQYHWTDGSSGAYRQLSNAKNSHFVYYRPGRSADGTDQTFFGAGLIADVKGESTPEGEEWTASLTEYKPFASPVAATELPSLHQQNSIQVISQPDFERIVALGGGGKASEFVLEALVDAVAAEGLLIDDVVLGNLFAALESGKHVVLTGPPGTGKTTLAQIVATLAQRSGRSRGTMLTTATADWTTFETIGGLRPSEDGKTLKFGEGHFLQAIETDSWLVIDELNRSNFDRAFGQLFTVLSGQAVTLPYTRGDPPRQIAIVPQGAETPLAPDADVVAVPASWRIVATMNVFDKSLLFEMSYALMRRFAFVEVPAPSDDDTIQLIEGRAGDNDQAIALATAFLKLRPIKDLGPAVFMDMAAFFRQSLDSGQQDTGRLAHDGFYGFLLPQFEGVDRSDAQKLFTAVGKVVGTGERERLAKTLRTVLGIEVAPPKKRLVGDETTEEELEQLEELEEPEV